MPPTAQTLAAALRGGESLSPGAASDYGYSENIYRLRRKPLPSTSQLHLLSCLYAELVSERDGVSELDRALRSGRLRRLLAERTCEDLSWVAFLNED